MNEPASGPGGLSIRAAGPDDAAAVAEVWLRAWESALSSEVRANSDDEVRGWVPDILLPGNGSRWPWPPAGSSACSPPHPGGSSSSTSTRCSRAVVSAPPCSIWFAVEIVASTTFGAGHRTWFGAALDPGYYGTAVMRGESALALALALDDLPDRAGALTPATALGAALTDRLRSRGFRITSGPAAEAAQ